MKMAVTPDSGRATAGATGGGDCPLAGTGEGSVRVSGGVPVVGAAPFPPSPASSARGRSSSS